MILVVGGAGYIGSHWVKELTIKAQVIVLDNLSTGHREAVDENSSRTCHHPNFLVSRFCFTGSGVSPLKPCKQENI